jgi:large subunit ribosomal protein L5
MVNVLTKKPGRRYKMAQLVKNQTVDPINRKYIEAKIHPQIMERMKYTNSMQLPRIVAVYVSMGTGRKIDIKMAKKALMSITGQFPVERKAKRSISGYGVRQGMVIGTKVSLRGDRMFHFLNTLIYVVLPSISSFKGLAEKSMVVRKDFITVSLGLSDITLFPGVDIPPAQQLGCSVTIVMKGACKAGAIMLFEHMGIPFRRNK